jgi:hypothetical protein
MSQITSRALRSRINYTGLTCLLLVAIGYIGVHAQTTAVSTGQPASATSVSPGVSQAILTVSSASQAAVDTPDQADTSANANNTLNNAATTEQSTSDDNTSLHVTVNGQSIDVPANGSTTQTIPSETGNGQTNVSISSSQSSTGTSNGYSFSSTNSNDSSSSSSVRFSSEHNSP